MADGDLSRLTNRPFDENLSEEENWETADEWQDELDKLRAEIDDMGVASDHSGRIEDIIAELKQLNIDIPQLEDETQNHGSMVAKYKAKWLDGDGKQPGLRQLIEAIHTYFSDSFAKLGNVGQVKLDEKVVDGHDDFEKYGLDIMVKFREGTELMHLGYFQSGGEKSLSIMIFMLSLQQHTVVPFRVVDEINQGMDANYERAIFQRICEESSKEETSQCFLITPKLQVHSIPNAADATTILYADANAVDAILYADVDTILYADANAVDATMPNAGGQPRHCRSCVAPCSCGGCAS